MFEEEFFFTLRQCEAVNLKFTTCMHNYMQSKQNLRHCDPQTYIYYIFYRIKLAYTKQILPNAECTLNAVLIL